MSGRGSLLRRLRSQLGLRLHRWRTRHTRHLFLSRDGDGFGLLGCLDPAVSVARTYLGETSLSALRTQRSWRPAGEAAFARATARRFGLAVIAPHAEPPSLRGQTLAYEHYLNVAIPLPADPESYLAGLRHSRRYEIRAMLRRGYHAETAKDAAWTDEFFLRHHQPTIAGRHGDDGYCSTPGELAALLARPHTEWLRIHQDGQCLAAAICERIDGHYKLHRLGWLDGSERLLGADIVAAIYWFSVRRAIELGARTLHLGGAPADLGNGLFHYKAKWGARLLPAEGGFQARHLLLDPSHPAARRFLATRALLLRDGAGGFVALSGLAPGEVPAAPSQAGFISAWFRLRASPETAAPQAKAFAALPPPLRPWFDLLPATS